MHIEHELHIDAPVAAVWGLTVDVESWPAITPTITTVRRLDHGPLAVGSRARIKQPGQPAATWTVTELEPGARFAWATTNLGMRMVGAHRLTATATGCVNTLSVDITGRTARLFGWLLRGRIRDAIATENEGFKRVAEQASTVQQPGVR
jgi:uncharacterized membrane protein